jgi:hypothetical protein
MHLSLPYSDLVKGYTAEAKSQRTEAKSLMREDSFTIADNFKVASDTAGPGIQDPFDSFEAFASGEPIHAVLTRMSDGESVSCDIN